MANTQDIRRRIKSIRNTAQITKAMQMVAASKMRKAQQHALAGRPYAALMNKVLVSLQKRTDPKLASAAGGAGGEKRTGADHQHGQRSGRRAEHQPVAGGGQFRSAKTRFVVTGRKARQFVARTKRELLADFELKDAPTFRRNQSRSRNSAWRNS